MKKLLSIFFLFALCLPAVRASDAATIKENMIKRLPQVRLLKSKGLIGENHLGYLEVVKGALPAADKKVFEEENADRQKVYEAIARQQGGSAKMVGEMRAKKILERARPGEYFKKADGTWSRN